VKVFKGVCVWMSQSRTSLTGCPRPTQGIRCSGGDTPVKVFKGVCVWMSQSRTVVSPDPLASWRPSGLKATVRTASVCPGSDHRQRTGN